MFPVIFSFLKIFASTALGGADDEVHVPLPVSGADDEKQSGLFVWMGI